jgi:hypothetical protein
VSHPLRLVDRLNNLNAEAPPKVSQMTIVTGKQAVLASRLNGKPATRKHGKPTRG